MRQRDSEGNACGEGTSTEELRRMGSVWMTRDAVTRNYGTLASASQRNTRRRRRRRRSCGDLTDGLAAPNLWCACAVCMPYNNGPVTTARVVQRVRTFRVSRVDSSVCVEYDSLYIDRIGKSNMNRENTRFQIRRAYRYPVAVRVHLHAPDSYGARDAAVELRPAPRRSQEGLTRHSGSAERRTGYRYVQSTQCTALRIA